MKTSDFNYDLPQELIAQTPVEPRDHSRLMVYRMDSDTVEHKHFYDIKDYLNKGDLIIVNQTKVIPARIFAKRLTAESIDYKDADKNTEILLLKRKEYDIWECITKPARKLKIGTKLYFSEDLMGEVVGYADEGIREIKFTFDGVFEDVLDRIGTMPLPPYITKKLEDQSRYQTVYSKINGSSAAPTAGLHFTPELMQALQDKGVEFAKVLLHVGLGTFRPVKVDDVTTHKMHSEHYEVDEENANIINQAVKEGRRIICVGTTTVRTLESVADENGLVKACKGETQIFIYPGYKFKFVKHLITNFHLPQSTLIMLVSALTGKEKTLELYKLAVQEKYRFFSFGDAMFFL